MQIDLFNYERQTKMGKKFNEYKGLDLSGIGKEVLDIWEVEDAFSKSLDARRDNPDFVFYEGLPSANGIHIKPVVERRRLSAFYSYYL